MDLTFFGPAKPCKAGRIAVNPQKASEYEGCLEGILDKLYSFDQSRGIADPVVKVVYQTFLGTVFRALTGERLPDYLNIWLLPKEEYMQKIIEMFGSEEAFRQHSGRDPMGIQAVNIGGAMIFMREEKNMGIVPVLFHEIGHRIYPDSDGEYERELSANYFMFLAMKKISTELSPHGFIISMDGFSADFHNEERRRAYDDAKRLVETGTPYVPKVRK